MNNNNNHDILFLRNGDILIAVERKPSKYDYYQKSEGGTLEKIPARKFRQEGKSAYHWELDIEAETIGQAQEIALDNFHEKTERTALKREMGFNAFGIA